MSTDALSTARSGFLSLGWPGDLVDEMLASFSEEKGRYYRGDLRPSAVEGGRFSEALLRLLQFLATGTYVSLSDRKFKADSVMLQLENLPVAQASDSVRLHIPRTLRVIYDIRNSRDTAHLRDGIDPNLQDATLVIGCMDWCLAEVVRIGHDIPPGEAQSLIADIVTKEVPCLQIFDGKPVLLANVKARDCILIYLYWAGEGGVLESELRSWLPANVRKNFLRTIRPMEIAKHVYISNGRVELTRLGFRVVEDGDLLKPI